MTQLDSEVSLPNSEPKDTSVEMVLITQVQRNALIEYLSKQPYQEVAAGINFLRDAPLVNVNLVLDDKQDATISDPRKLA
jgi:hypothetical protein